MGHEIGRPRDDVIGVDKARSFLFRRMKKEVGGPGSR